MRLLFLLTLTLLGCATHSAPGAVSVTRGTVSPEGTSVTRVSGEFQFADIPWFSSPELTRDGYQDAGLDFLRTTEDGDLVFTARIAGEQAAVIAYFGEDRLLRVRLVFDSSRPLTTYSTLREVLLEAHGQPSPVYTGSFLVGMRQGGLDQVDVWIPEGRRSRPPGPGELASFERIELMLFREGEPSLEYLTPQWETERQRRNRRGTEILRPGSSF